MDQQTTEEAKKDEGLKETVENTEEVAAEITAGTSEDSENTGEEISKEEQLLAQLDEEKKKYVYLAAEFENTKRRLQKEKENLAKFGTESLLSDLVRVADNLDRTLNALQGKEDPATKNIMVGINMVHKQFIETLSSHGLKKLESDGKEFDPNFHEAMGEEESEDVESNHVVSVFEEAYELNGRLLRAAKVIVAK